MEKYLYEDLNNLEKKHWWHISKRKYVLNIIKQNIDKKNPKILDIGCGTGQNIKELSKIGDVWGIDNSKEAIKYCKLKNIDHVKLGSSEKTGFSESFFDVITLLDVLEHVEEDTTLEEIKKVLKKDGFLIITVPAFKFLWSKWDEVLHHKRRYTKKSLIKALEKNGFKTVKINYLYSYLFLPVLLIRPLKSLSKSKSYSSDFKINSNFVNRTSLIITNIERYLSDFVTIPFGTSIICLAKNEK